MKKIKIDYANFDQKAEYFYSGDKIIHTSVEKLFELLEWEYKLDNNPFVYRGLEEAKYFLFSSSQRSYIKEERYLSIKQNELFSDYESFVMENISKLRRWNNGIIDKLFKANGITENNTLAYLSFMQHHGIATPLLDFTRNPFIALYFAISDHNGTVNYDSGSPLESFFSIYKIYKPTFIHEMFRGFFVANGFDMNCISYKELSNSIGLYLISNEDEELRLCNNANIINQEGLFYYNHHPFCPLEIKFNLTVKDLKSDTRIDSRITKDLPKKLAIAGIFIKN
ncbi:MAG TPA: FRG domain-containing protein [Cytophagaceae bacterium]|jgi:hypothetical protein